MVQRLVFGDGILGFQVLCIKNSIEYHLVYYEKMAYKSVSPKVLAERSELGKEEEN